MMRKLFLVVLMCGTTAGRLSAQGFGGAHGDFGPAGGLPGGSFGFLGGPGGDGIRGTGGLWANGIGGSGGLWGDGIYGAGGLPQGEIFRGVWGPYSGFRDNRPGGFGNASGNFASYRAVNAQQSMAAPQVNPNARRESFAREASNLGFQMGGFRAGQLGPMISDHGMPTDTGLHQAGNTARGSAISQNGFSANLRVAGNFARSNFKDYGAFGRDWYRAHSSAWRGNFRAGAWSSAAWADINGWFGYGWPAYGYDYGIDLTYANNTVYLDGQPIADAAKYYQSAANLVLIGQRAPGSSAPAPTTEWLPLGVFAAIPPGQKSSQMLMQLAVNKAGIIRGNYYNTGDNNVQLIEGSIDKNTGRAAWVVADKKEIVFDTSLYNLTRPEAAILVHMDQGKNEQWLFVRLQQAANATKNQ